MPTALIVEDDDATRVLIAAICARHGFQAEVAADGETAIARLRGGRYDVLVLDLLLPKVNGFELIREVRSRCPELLRRTIVVTAAGPSILADFEGGAVFTLLRKPFDVADLVAALKACAPVAENEVAPQRISFPMLQRRELP
jgi:two-component system, OmpR family, response regulator